jgi:hypothetical protein
MAARYFHIFLSFRRNAKTLIDYLQEVETDASGLQQEPPAAQKNLRKWVY